MANSTLSVGGLATGIDTKSLVSQLMALERQPETLLTAQKTAAQKQIDAYNLLNTSLANFKTVMAGMNTSSTFQSMTASVADSTFMTAQASSSAASGVHTVTVNNLATFQRQVSDQIGFISEVGHSSGRRNGAPAECSVRKMAVLTVIADVLAGRSLAAYCGVLPVRSIAGYYWSPGRAKPRDHWCLAFPGVHDVF